MPDRHAEENLMDILEHRLTKLEFLTETPIIVGKKRPCFTCHARLTSLVAEESGIELEFNPNKGLLYKMAAYKQDKKSAKATAESLVYSSEVFVSTAGGSGYATMSDSEEDEPKLGAVAKLSVT